MMSLRFTLRGRSRSVGILLFSFACTSVDAYQLIDNFSGGWPSTGSVVHSVDAGSAKAGRACGQFSYSTEEGQRYVDYRFPEPTRVVTEPGTFKLWLKGDGSGTPIEFALCTAEVGKHGDGRTYYHRHQHRNAPAIPLDFQDWREITLELPDVPKGRVAWVYQCRLHGRRGKDATETTGEFRLDDLRFFPAKRGAASSTHLIRLDGPDVREFSSDIAFSVDVRNFTDTNAKAKVRLSMTDRNENTVVDRDFVVAVGAGESVETLLALKPENIELFLPPFKITGDLFSADIAQLSARIDETIVMGNAYLLFDDFSDVFGRWFTAGPDFVFADQQREWVSNFVASARQRCNAFVQTRAKIARVPIDAPGVPGRYALRFDYQAAAMVYCGADRFLPGNAYRLGVWVKGDGSGNEFFVNVFDYTDLSDFGPHGYGRTRDSYIKLCDLDSDDWQYVEVPLPGNGIGKNTRKGSSQEIDYPLEVSAFVVQQPRGRRKDEPERPQAGTILIGGVHCYTQVRQAEALAVHIAYDDPEHYYAAQHGADVTVQNASLSVGRRVRAVWELFDGNDETVVSGIEEMALPSRQQSRFRIELSRSATAIDRAGGPLRLRVTVSDTEDGAISASREIALAKLDCVATVNDFEVDRGYLGLRPFAVENLPAEGQAVARTTTDAAHSGKRSLRIDWRKEPQSYQFVSLDPSLPGVPTDIAMWVHGDGSGVLLYPLVGDRVGISTGLHGGGSDLLLPRALTGDLQNAVRVDWQGWREVSFRLPLVPPGWRDRDTVLPYVPSYPLGVHLAMNVDTAGTEAGTVFVDDIRVRTHAPSPERVRIAFERPPFSNLFDAGSRLGVTLMNMEMAKERFVRLQAYLADWRGRQLHAFDRECRLAPGETRSVTVVEVLPSGAFAFGARLSEDGIELGRVEEDVLCADLQPLFQEAVSDVIGDEHALRQPIRATFALVDEDWDWMEHYPGALQLITARQRLGEMSAVGRDPYLFLGYSALYAGGLGFEEMQGSSFVRRPRDLGHAVDTFFPPERIEDWDAYVCDVLRGLGTDVGGWVLWDRPDGSPPLGVPPAKFAAMMQSVGKWQDRYCPEKPVLIGGLSPETAIPYLCKLGELKALDAVDGVSVRLDVGRLSPEDARVLRTVGDLRRAAGDSLNSPRRVVLTDLDWAVESDPEGIDMFDHAAYLVRTVLLLDPLGIRPIVELRNEDDSRLGLGLVYRRRVHCPPMLQKEHEFMLKPAWWALCRLTNWLDSLENGRSVAVCDVVPGRTQAVVYTRKKDGKTVLFVWRDDDPGFLRFGWTESKVEMAEDVLGAPVQAGDAGYPVGKMPTLFVLNSVADSAHDSLSLLWVSDGPVSTWAQRPLASFTPFTGDAWQCTAPDATPAEFAGKTVSGDECRWRGVRIPQGGAERFRVAVTPGTGLVLRKRYLLENDGHSMAVALNGKVVGEWDLRASAGDLSGGLREAEFIVPPTAFAGSANGTSEASVEIRYRTDGNSSGWTVFEYAGGGASLSALGPIHVAQNVLEPRIARNMIGEGLRVGDDTFANGIGVFANSLIEYPLNAQYTSFSAKVGVDRVTEGKGSVVFEVYTDGKKVWSSGVMSGLDAARDVELPVNGINRLRLVVTDAGDGNRFDAADWCEPALSRQ